MKIIWSKKAFQTWLEIADHISYEFGEKALADFTYKTRQWERIIVSMPLIGKREPLLEGREQIYRSVTIHKLNKVVYHLKKDTIYIVAFWDTRREPRTLTNELN